MCNGQDVGAAVVSVDTLPRELEKNVNRYTRKEGSVSQMIGRDRRGTEEERRKWQR
jgi:hypothetical protein